MRERGSPSITIAELEQRVRETDPAAILVPTRILRRVIKQDRGIAFVGLRSAHRASYVIASEALRAIVEADEIGLPAGSSWPDIVILLARPEPEDLADRRRECVLAEVGQLVFQSGVEVEIQRRFEAGLLDESVLHARIDRIGRLEFAEVREVLRQDGHLLPPRNERDTYTRFAAVFLALRYFSPGLLAHVFPAIDDPVTVEEALRQDVDIERLAAKTRAWREGASEKAAGRAGVFTEDLEDAENAAEASPGFDRWLTRRAEAVAQKGNLVRAALLWTQAARRDGPVHGRRARLAARGELDRLSRRLQAALGFDDAELDRWRRTLPTLLDRAARGFWTPEARLLYDLQKLCNDHERDVYTVDLVEWGRSLGGRPIKRSLPALRAVLIVTHLRRAVGRLPATRLPHDHRDRLRGLLAPAAHRAEESLRGRFRPIIHETLTGAGYHAANLPERVAYRKLIEELLDRIVDRGFLTIGDLRDACSRSQLKMPDLSGPGEFLRGDRLLRADVGLAEALDGVHRRGEIYLRLLQRLSALAFGRPVGRFLTLFAALPFGATYVALTGVQHLLELFRVHVHLVSPVSLLLIGTVVLGLLNFRRFRRGFFKTTLESIRAVHSTTVQLVGRLARLPWIVRIASSRTAIVLWRYAAKPLIALAPIVLLGRAYGHDGPRDFRAAAFGFACLSILLNSRAGRDLEEMAGEGAARLWGRLRDDLVLGAFRLILAIFHRFLEAVERVLYAVDEWLRFRTGQRRSSLALKAVLGFVWFFVAYIVRFYVNLLIEPQVNPIKHFPVVTVSHKIILPLSKTLTLLLAAPLMPLGPVAAYFLAGTTVLLLPGVFGFLVWELWGNWRLYEANRPEALKPVVVGSHGETMVRLLRPGLHSGTVPKLFGKLRKAERLVLAGGRDRGVLKRREALHHAEEEVRRFIDRDLLALLSRSRSLAADCLQAGTIELATNRIRIEILSGSVAGVLLQLNLEEERGVLRARIAWGPGAPELEPDKQRTLMVALLGLAKLSGADAIVEDDGDAPAGVSEQAAAVQEALAGVRAPLATFDEVAITWRRWVETWEREQAQTGAVETPSARIGLAADAELA